MPKVTVIVPIYNVEKYLARCIDSLVNQTLNEIEIVLVNDGTKDSSGKIAMQYAKQYKEKIIYLEKENGGLSDARNYGLAYAKGEYIAFLDSDDYIEKDAYEKMYEKAKLENADYVECDFIWEYPNKKRKDKCYQYNNKKEMLAFARVVAWNKLIKREIIEENNIRFPKGLRYEDIEFTYKLIPHLNKICYVDQCFIHYIQRKNSIANVQNEKTAEIFEILDNVIRYYKEKNLFEEYRNELEYNYARYLLCSSLKRICKIGNKQIRKRLIRQTWSKLNIEFPEWKENKILKDVHIKKNIYMKTINKFTYNIYTIFWQII
ncbi:MAG: glycosyltransferase family 2 protein [Clostridia bacterium]|jgi:glycosyltransferase involved in cell wall biosynthesis|nr:glycosyl transferase 2 family protein [Clostridium sp. CAG:798]